MPAASTGGKIELITRDTQSDPTKAVNGAAELTRGQKVSVVFGPVNSGESLAVVPLLARDNMPQVHPCWVDSLTDRKKYPMCFRNAPTNQQIGGAANRYVVDVLKRKKVAVISDTTGYGTASVNAYAPMLKAKGAEVVYQGNVDAANPDLKPELLRMQIGGRRSDHAVERQCRLPVAHHQHPRRRWAGTCRSSARPRSAPARPRLCWRSPNTGTRSIRTISARSATPRRQAADRTKAFVDRLKSAKIDMGDTLLWWIALGYDSPRLIADAMKAVGTEPASDRRLSQQAQRFSGRLRRHLLYRRQHDGYPDDEVVMVEANSLKDGAFNLAPGYSA